jgi:hypothetical protein
MAADPYTLLRRAATDKIAAAIRRGEIPGSGPIRKYGSFEEPPLPIRDPGSVDLPPIGPSDIPSGPVIAFGPGDYPVSGVPDYTSTAPPPLQGPLSTDETLLQRLNPFDNTKWQDNAASNKSSPTGGVGGGAGRGFNSGGNMRWAPREGGEYSVMSSSPLFQMMQQAYGGNPNRYMPDSTTLNDQGQDYRFARMVNPPPVMNQAQAQARARATQQRLIDLVRASKK